MKFEVGQQVRTRDGLVAIDIPNDEIGIVSCTCEDDIYEVTFPDSGNQRVWFLEGDLEPVES